MTQPKCNDCGNAARPMSAKSLREGSQVREPGEQLCPGCSSHRVLLVRQCEKIPNTIAEILAKRVAPIQKVSA